MKPNYARGKAGSSWWGAVLIFAVLMAMMGACSFIHVRALRAWMPKTKSLFTQRHDARKAAGHELHDVADTSQPSDSPLR